MSVQNVDELGPLGGPVVVLEQGRHIGQLPAERVRLDTVTNVVMKPNFRLDFNTVCTDDGALYTAASPGYLFTSRDQGRTWRRIQMTHLLHGKWKGNDVLDVWIGRRIRGMGIAKQTLLLLMECTDSGSAILRVVRSSDGAASWSEPSDIDPSPYDGAGTDASGFYSLPDGTILLSVELCYSSETGNKADLPLEKQGLRSHVYFSYDGGKTWADKCIIGENTCETQLLLKRDGTILGVIRRQGSSLLAKESQKTLFLADSYDQGRTWVNLRQFSKEVGSCHGEAVQLSDGRVVLIYNKRYPHEDGDVRACVSSDGGETWGPHRYVVCKGQGYPGSVVLKDDMIVTVTGDEKQSPQSLTLPPGHTAQVIRWRIP